MPLLRRLFPHELDQDGWKSVPSFTKYIQDTYKVTTTKRDDGSFQPITANWVHFRISTGYMPLQMGGRKIEKGMFADVVYVRLHPTEVHEKKSAGRKPGSPNKKGNKNKVKHISLLGAKELLGRVKSPSTKQTEL